MVWVNLGSVKRGGIPEHSEEKGLGRFSGVISSEEESIGRARPLVGTFQTHLVTSSSHEPCKLGKNSPFLGEGLRLTEVNHLATNGTAGKWGNQGF